MANLAWRYNSKYGVAYLEDRTLVDKVLELEGRKLRLDKAVMATYLTPGGKTFAWQVVFSMGEWDDVSRALGLEVKERAPVRVAEKSPAKTAKTTKTKTAVKATKKASPKAAAKPRTRKKQ